MNALDVAKSLEGGNVLDARFPADLEAHENVQGKCEYIFKDALFRVVD